LELLGSKLYTRDPTLSQYVGWAVDVGLFDLVASQGSVAIATVCAHTPLNEAGADSLLGVLTAIGLTSRNAERYALTSMARDYFLRTSPFYIGDQFRSRGAIHRGYLRGQSARWRQLRFRLYLMLFPAFRFGHKVRLRNQHARNLAACAAAVRTGEFDGIRCMVDIAGGSGTFSIPLALSHPIERIVLSELPQAIENIRPNLIRHGVEGRVELLALDALSYPWQIPPCDGIFIGNFLHSFDDAACSAVCREAFQRLSPGGKLWIHEMLWNPNKDGPLITALTHAEMRKVTRGRQRTAQELTDMLRGAGFVNPYVVRTAGAFALIAAARP
jgi:acetylserotonin N-methyltransferase